MAIDWDASATTLEDQRKVTFDGIVDAFATNKVTREQVVQHCDRVWESITHNDPSYKEFKIYTTSPSDDTTLNESRNRRRLKHVMMGQMIWNSLTSFFQIDIMPHKSDFQRNQEYDGPLLWDYIRCRVKPSTTVGASKLKDELENKTLSDFGNNVIKYNSWFVDTRDQIIREEGDGYNEYTRSLFRAYKTSPNEEFRDAIASEKRNWTQGKLPVSYTFLDLMELARLEFNNLVEDDTWETNRSKLDAENQESKILALATEILDKVNVTQRPGSESGTKNTLGGEGGRQFQQWRFENPNNEPTKLVRGTTMRWCTNDCHQRPMWCGRKNCLTKAEYATAMAEKRKGGHGGNSNPKDIKNKLSNEFRIALAALTTPEDFASLEDQFFSGKE